MQASQENSRPMPKPVAQPLPVATERKQLLPRFKVLLHNDDVNDMEHVVRALIRVFRFDRAECERIMMEAHQRGVALCIVEPLEQAEFHRDQLIALSLISTIEPE
jgi:ATP-dependent Clp protease adaptor protein ClpS